MKAKIIKRKGNLGYEYTASIPLRVGTIITNKELSGAVDVEGIKCMQMAQSLNEHIQHYVKKELIDLKLMIIHSGNITTRDRVMFNDKITRIFEAIDDVECDIELKD